MAEAENVQFFSALAFTVQKLVNRFRTLELNNHKGVLERGELLLNWRAASPPTNRSSATPRLSELLAKMMEKPGVIFMSGDLFKAVWDTDYVEDMRTLDVHHWLRKRWKTTPPIPT